MGKYSSILFPNPSFAEGFARIVDFGDSLTQYNTSESAESADKKALYSDWLALGEDAETAFEQANEEGLWCRDVVNGENRAIK